MDNWVRITYFHTLYNREVTKNAREITFKDGNAYFGGEMIAIEYLRKVEAIND